MIETGLFKVDSLFKFRKFKIDYKKEHRDFRMSRNFCNFEVPTKKYKSLMPNDKGTNVFSEIGKFFKEKDATSAMNAIMAMMDALSLSEKGCSGLRADATAS